MDDLSPLEQGIAYIMDGESSKESSESEETTSASSILTRRKTLAGVATIGTAGAITGAGTRSFFSDAELFGNNVAESGDLDLGLAWETYYNPADGDRELVDSEGNCSTDGDSGKFISDSRPAITLSDVRPGDSGETKICLQLEDNPGWLWLGATCPDPGLEKAINARVTYDGNCDGESEAMLPDSFDSGGSTTVISGSLCEVLVTLTGGVRLGEDCVSPTTTHCLTLEWDFPEPTYHNQFEEYEGEELEFRLDFIAEQCRHNEEPTNPMGRVCGQESCREDGPAISWIAFCVDGGDIGDGDVDFEVLEQTVDDEPNKVGWDSGNTQLSTVVIYYGSPDGPIIENFYIDDGFTTGTATIGEGDERTFKSEDDDQSPSDPCPSGETGIKYEWDGNQFIFET